MSQANKISDTWIFDSEESLRENLEKFPPDELSVLQVLMYHHDLLKLNLKKSIQLTSHSIMQEAQRNSLETISLTNLSVKIGRLYKKYRGLKKHLDRFTDKNINQRRTFLKKLLGDFKFEKSLENGAKKMPKKCSLEKKKESSECYAGVTFIEKRIRKEVTFN